MKNILITGSNRGLGLEFVKQYLADGERVFACCRTPESAEALQSLQQYFADRLSIHALDVDSDKSIDQLVNSLSNQPIDILINNAGIYRGKHDDFGKIDYDAWAEIFRVNTMAPIKITECFLPNLQSGVDKKLIFISSKMGSIADNTSGGSYLYRSSKSALNSAVKSLAHDLSEKGMTAVILHPGWVLTDMGGPNALINTEQSIAGMKKLIADADYRFNGRFFAYDGQEISW